jgi:hypothetical protein
LIDFIPHFFSVFEQRSENTKIHHYSFEYFQTGTRNKNPKEIISKPSLEYKKTNLCLSMESLRYFISDVQCNHLCMVCKISLGIFSPKSHGMMN